MNDIKYWYTVVQLLIQKNYYIHKIVILVAVMSNN